MLTARPCDALSSFARPGSPVRPCRLIPGRRGTPSRLTVDDILATIAELGNLTGVLSTADPNDRAQLYEALGVKHVINATGTVTILGGSLMPPEVVAGAWHQLGTYIAWEESDTPEVPYRLPRLDQAAVDERTPGGSPEQVLDKLGPWIQAFGWRRLTAVYRLHYPGMTYEQAAPAVELFAAQVAPELRRLGR